MRRILLVDDQTHIRKVAELALRTLECDLLTAEDGQEAWDVIQAKRPDLLVTDVQMPRMNGIELLRLIRTSPEFASLPVILLTAKGFELSTEDRAFCATCQLVCKPFSPAALARDVKQALERLEAPAAAVGVTN